jgi:hypothetical protein
MRCSRTECPLVLLTVLAVAERAASVSICTFVLVQLVLLTVLDVRAASVSICTFVLVQLVLLTVLDVQGPSVLWCYSVYLLYWHKSTNTDRQKYKY